LTVGKRSLIRQSLLLAPAVALVGYIMYLIVDLKTLPNIYDPYEALIISFLIAVALTPSAIYEYKLEWEVRGAEAEVPVLLSVVENNLRAGLTLPQALEATTDYLSFLRRDLVKLLNTLSVGEPVEEGLKHFRRDTPLLAVTADYLKIIARGGEELYKTLKEFREAVEIIVNYGNRLKEATRSYIGAIYMVMFVYLVTTAVFLKTFIYPLSAQAGVSAILTPIDPKALTSLIIYGALIESLINGFTISYFTGSKYFSSLFHALVLLFPSIAIYAVLLFTSL
jgi:pilus assembly protein TadC